MYLKISAIRKYSVDIGMWNIEIENVDTLQTLKLR